MPTLRVIFSFPFRVFFLITGLFGLAMIWSWVAVLMHGAPIPVGWSSVHWHSHEMIFGFVPAAIAGFLMTAMCNWTGAKPLQGWGLAGLVSIWLAGRMVMWTADWWPSLMVILVDMAFLPAMAMYVAKVLLAHGNKRNLMLVGILLLLATANGLTHLGFAQQDISYLAMGEAMALNLVTLMMAIIGGRIIPMFTRNWLRRNGTAAATSLAEKIGTTPMADRLALIVTTFLIPVGLLTDFPALPGVLALLASALHGWRLTTWKGWTVTKAPILWSLHLGYLWIVIALALKGLASFGLVSLSSWYHAIGVGAMGTLIIAIMSRVSLGHTGRALDLPRFGVWMYWAIFFAAVSRVVMALGWMDFHAGLELSVAGWSLAFGVFLWGYWPILSCPRVNITKG